MGKAYFNEANVFAGFLLFRLPLRLCNRQPENVFNRHGWLAVICQRVAVLSAALFGNESSPLY